MKKKKKNNSMNCSQSKSKDCRNESMNSDSSNNDSSLSSKHCK